MGNWRNYWTTLPTGDNWPTGEPVHNYGRNLPIQDCTSGVCRNSYLMWNGYIPAYLINSMRPESRTAIMGIPADYKPAVAPLWPYPADYPSRSEATDPNYDNYGSNTFWSHQRRHRSRSTKPICTRDAIDRSRPRGCGPPTLRSSRHSLSRSGLN